MPSGVNVVMHAGQVTRSLDKRELLAGAQGADAEGALQQLIAHGATA